MNCRGWLMVSSLLAYLPHPCLAKDHPTRHGVIYSLEWLVASADVVVIAKFGDRPLAEDGAWYKVDARALETLKGDAMGEFEFAVYRDRDLISGHRDREVLLFLNRKNIHSGGELGPPPSPLFLYPLSAAWSINSLDGGPEGFAVNMDFAVLTRPQDILAATRSAVAHDRGKPDPKSYTIGAIPPRLDLCDWVHGLNLPRIRFPRDDRLEQAARRWTKSRNPYVRVEGTAALRLYRSNENIAILKDLLADPEVLGGRRLVREAASNTLKSWDIEVAGPGPWATPGDAK